MAAIVVNIRTPSECHPSPFLPPNVVFTVNTTSKAVSFQRIQVSAAVRSVLMC
jgi:hypothetical protein